MVGEDPAESPIGRSTRMKMRSSTIAGLVDDTTPPARCEGRCTDADSSEESQSMALMSTPTLDMTNHYSQGIGRISIERAEGR